MSPFILKIFHLFINYLLQITNQFIDIRRNSSNLILWNEQKMQFFKTYQENFPFKTGSGC